MENARFTTLVDQIYRAAFDDGAWPALTNTIAAAFNTGSTVVQLRDLPRGGIRILGRTPNASAKADLAYRDYYHRLDIWTERGALLAPMVTMEGAQVIAPEAFAETEIYQDFFKSLGIFHVIGAAIPVSRDQLGIIGIHRARGDGVFRNGAPRALDLLLPHLQRSLQLRARLVPATAELPETRDQDSCVLVVDRDMRLLRSSAVADDLLRHQNGLLISEGQLVCQNARATATLAKLVFEAAATTAARCGTPGGFVSVPRSNLFPLAVQVAPFSAVRNIEGDATPAAILIVRDPLRTSNTFARTVQTIFALSPAEAAIAEGLARGTSIHDIAAHNGVTYHTARTQLKALMRKTGTSRQGELIALLLKSLPAA